MRHNLTNEQNSLLEIVKPLTDLSDYYVVVGTEVLDSHPSCLLASRMGIAIFLTGVGMRSNSTWIFVYNYLSIYRYLILNFIAPIWIIEMWGRRIYPMPSTASNISRGHMINVATNRRSRKVNATHSSLSLNNKMAIFYLPPYQGSPSQN